MSGKLFNLTASFLISLFLSFVAITAFADVYVSGYCRKDGVCVQGYWRSSPDSSYNNNFSTRGNINPYTGRAGTNRRTYDDRRPRYNAFGTCVNCR
ncbi:MAG: hypothetical protein ACON44_01375 [Candidatus Puniceispirillaceae bacterium]